MEEVAFKSFARLGSERGWTVEMLAERFQDKIERPREFFERALTCKWKNPDTGRYEDRSGVVIPYRSALQFYFTELKTWQESTGRKTPLTAAQLERSSLGGKTTAKRRQQPEVVGT